MNTFKIENIRFNVNDVVSDTIIINSFPQNYTVKFAEFNNFFLHNEVVLVDKNVRDLYNISHTKMIVVEALEENKTMDTVLEVCELLLEFGVDKGFTLVVIGGGIIQDIGAYAAKTFKRGINWVYYPTTLLSQCDSCIGGKTSLNFLKYKNQLALFSAPNSVIIDTRFLDTLTDLDIKSGYGEIVKLFLIGGDYYVDNFNFLTKEEMIFHALSIKKSVIDYDEFEKLERKSLNYGHSFGHVIETITNYTIPHGEAVMLGIEIINRLYSKSKRLRDLIGRFTSLDKLKNINLKELINGLLTDKKVSDGIISFVIVESPGVTKFIKTTIDGDLEKNLNEFL